MVKLILRNGSTVKRELPLRPGKNSVGRNPACDILIADPTVSSHHAEITVTPIAVLVEDLESTNGTYLNGQRFKKGVLQPGQVLRFGEVEMVLETPEAHIAIPEIKKEVMASSVVFDDGSLSCLNHQEVLASQRCTKCQECFCDDCVRVMKRVLKDAPPLLLCPNCSGECESMTMIMTKPKKQSFFSKLHETLRLSQPPRSRRRR